MIQAIDLRDGGDVRIRLAGPRDYEIAERNGGSPIIYSRACMDWLLITGFDGQQWPHAYRHTSFREIIRIAWKEADGVCSVFFRPLDSKEIEEHDRRQLEDKNAARKNTYREAAEVLLFPVVIYALLRLHDHLRDWRGSVFLVLILGAAWIGTKWMVYRVGYAIERGREAGRRAAQQRVR
jgi:hypothetical protein